MDFQEYQTRSRVFDTHTGVYKDRLLIYAAGLSAEAGEVLGKVYKHVRDGTDVDADALVLELGDVLWFISQVASLMGRSLEEVAESNILKLHDRNIRGVIQGSGDNR